jgi:homoserine dehydrogenase
VVNNLLSNFAEGTEGSERKFHEQVLGFGTIGSSVLNILSRVDVEELKMSLDVSVALFEVLKSLCDFFFQFIDFSLQKCFNIKNLRRSS